MSDPNVEIFDLQPTRIGAAIVVVLTVMALLSVAAYGAVDVIALGLLSLGCMVVVWLWVADSWRQRGFTYNSSPLQLALAGLILIGLIQLLPLRWPDMSGLLSIAPSHSLSLDANATAFALVKLFTYLIFFAAALNFTNTHRRFYRVTIAILAFGAVMAVFAILQKLSSAESIYGMRETVQANIFGPYVNGHHFAALMEMTLGLSLGLLYGKSVRKELRVIYLAAAVIMGVAIMMTGSRGGLLSFIGVLGMVTIFSLSRRRETNDGKVPEGQKKLLLIGGGLTFLLLMAGIGSLLGGEHALRGAGLNNDVADISSGRLHFWWVALQVFRDNFLLGGGLDAFGVAFTRYDTWNGAFRIEQAHNDYLQTLADAGVLGFACVAAFIFFLFRGALRVINSARDRFHRSAAIGALAGCFGVMIHSFFDFPLRTPANMLVFLLLGALATVTLRKPTA
jgi:O-antigen ligase